MNRFIAVAAFAVALTSGCVDQSSPPGGGGEDPDVGPAPDMLTDSATLIDSEPECTPSSEVCNGVDDDCDGEIDNGFNIGQACTVEQNGCTSDGMWACSDDGLAAVCDAPAPEASDEVCDDADNDCDGAADEDFDFASDPANCGGCAVSCDRPNAEVACAMSACALTGCVEGFGDADGDPENGCECAISGDEVCDGVDNDCDGTVDEGLGLGEACSVGIGACAADGETVCGDDGAVVCGAQPGAPVDEQCNSVDDDCDGTTDEGFDEDGDGAPGCGIDCDAPCPAGVDCDALCPIQDCAPDDGSVYPNAPEICEDGIDQNCDGRDIECDVPAGRIEQVAIAARDDPNCRDINGDGRPDNAFGPAGPIVNGDLQQSVDDEQLNLLPIAPGLLPPGTDGVFDFGVLYGSPEADAYRVSPDSLDEDGLPLMLFPGTRIADGALNAGPGTFLLTLRNGDEEAELRIIETIITGDMSVNDAGVTLNDGWVTGIVTEEDFQAALVIVPPDFRALVPLLIQPDVDQDGDGQNDAYSACVSASGSPASVVGYPPE